MRLLGDHAMVVVSGTKLASEIGTGRSEVWRLIQQLRGLGVEIAGHPATGYRLERVPDLLLPEIVGPLLRRTIFDRDITHYFKIGSTNAAAMEAAMGDPQAPEGSVFFAEEQTRGRGRGDHSWHSARSQGIYCSVVLRPKGPPADILPMTLAAGLAAASAVEGVTGLKPDLRWPNDVLVGGQKFCGILAEMNAEPTRVRHVVLGIGMNVNQASFPAELRQVATSLRIESGREWSRVDLAVALLKSLDREYRQLATAAEPESVFRRFEQNSSYARAMRVHVDEEGGYEGVTEGLDNRGFLKVRTSGGTRTVLSGGVRKA